MNKILKLAIISFIFFETGAFAADKAGKCGDGDWRCVINSWAVCNQESDCISQPGVCGQRVIINKKHKQDAIDLFNNMDTKCAADIQPQQIPGAVCVENVCTAK